MAKAMTLNNEDDTATTTRSDTRPPLTPTHEGLLKAIASAPDDDLPRLVLADLLEENGEAERAAYIRTQIELAKLTEDDPAYDEISMRRLRHDYFEEQNWWRVQFRLGHRTVQLDLHRGFPERARMSASRFLRSGRFFAVAPVTRLELTDVGPQLERPNGPGQPRIGPDLVGRLAGAWHLSNVRELELSDSFVWGRTVVNGVLTSPHARAVTRFRCGRTGVRVDLAELSHSQPPPSLRVLGPVGDQDGGIGGVGRLGHGLAGLTALNLDGTRLGEGDVRVLAASPALGRVEHLGLAGTGLTDAGALAIARSDALRSLRFVDVSRNQLGGAAIAALRARAAVNVTRDLRHDAALGDDPIEVLPQWVW